VSLYESTYRSDVWNDVNSISPGRTSTSDERSAATSAATTTTSDWSSSSRGISVGWPPRATTQTAVPTPPSQPTSTGRGSTSTTDTSVLASGLRDAIDEEPGTSVYGRPRASSTLVAADVDDLAVRLDARRRK